MAPPRSKYSGGKIASHSDLRAEADLGGPSGLNTTKPESRLRLDFCNIRGINTNINSVHQHLTSSKPHILALAETKVNSNTPHVHLNIPGYDLHSRFRHNFGLAVFIRDDLCCQREESYEPKDFDVMWFKLSTDVVTKFICCLYRPPSEHQYERLFSNLGNRIDFLQINYPTAEITIVGDFNVHNIDWLKHSNKNDDEGREAETFAISHNLTQLVDEPTRIPDRQGDFASLLDLFLTSNPDLYTVTVQPPLGSSDHNLISATCELAIKTQEPQLPRKVWHYKSAKWRNLREFYLHFPWIDVCFKNRNTSESADEITQVILAGMEAFIPSSIKRPSKNKPWFDKSCSRAVNSKNAAYREWRRNPTVENRNTFIIFRNLCKQTVDECKERHNEQIKNKLLNCPNGSRSFWSVAKAVSQGFSKSSIPPLTKDDGSIAETAKEKANILAEMFASNSTLDPQGKIPPTIPRVNSSMPGPVFRQREVKRILKGLDTNKAVGPDGVPAIVLKKCAAELTAPLCRLFSLSYRSACFPSSWKCAQVQPIPKKGKKTVPSNYRPIALVPIISKVMEKLINEQLLKYLESSNIISDRQYGFRKHRSTGDLLAYVTHLWTRAIESYGESRAVALDISKAFDRVWHDGLLCKLTAYGLPPTLLRWLSSFLKERSIRVGIDGHFSEKFKINAGVPQGCILSPTLFLLYINDLLGKTNNSIYSFADDSTLISSFTSQTPMTAAHSQREREHQIASINEDMNTIVEWGDNNIVQFNAGKTQAAIFSKKANTAGSDLKMTEQTLTLASSINLLGVNVENNMSWRNHVTKIAKAASQKLGALFRAKNLYTSHQLLLLYKAQIRPSLEYCSHIWSSAPKHLLKMLDSIQKRAVRLIDDPELTKNLHSLDHRRKVADLSLFYRYYYGRCSNELALLIPPRVVPNRNTRQAQAAHQHTIQLQTPRTSLFRDSFFWRTASLWNELPRHTFPENYNLQRFKTNAHRHLSTHTAR